jgi:hypothetical protein
MKKLPKAFAIVHRRVVLVHPFSDAVLLTGLHNLGRKASDKNDEILLIIRGAPNLASASATNIMALL